MDMFELLVSIISEKKKSQLIFSWSGRMLKYALQWRWQC